MILPEDLQRQFEELLTQPVVLEGRVTHQLMAGQSGRVALIKPVGQVSAVQARAWGEIRPGQACLVAQDKAGNWHVLPTEGTQLVRRRVVGYRHSLPPVVASRGPVKILYTISRDSSWEFWIGGDAPPRMAFRTPWVDSDLANFPCSARITNSGQGVNDWIIYIDVAKLDINSIAEEEIGRLLDTSSLATFYRSIFVISPSYAYELTNEGQGPGGGT